MLSYRFRLALMVTAGLCGVTISLAPPSQAAPVGLAFDLPQRPVTEPMDKADADLPYRPLPIPEAAAHPPTRNPAVTRQNSRVYQTKAAPEESPVAQLPPPPPGAAPQPRILTPQLATPAPSAPPTPQSSRTAQVTENQPSNRTADDDIALGFAPVRVDVPTTPAPDSAETAAETDAVETAADTDWIFEGGPDSLVARIVGSAEGTRTPTGERTRHYNGHRDPGNGVWNLGTFSYQHGASSPEEADAKQLARLARQENTLDRKAQRLGLQLSLVERLNALDLANQSPAAALNPGGYIDRLYQAQQAGKTGNDAILWARTYSYMNPKTQRWNAPGLGNTYPSIRRDQNRRLQAIASALDAFQMQQALAERPGNDVATANPQPRPSSVSASRTTPEQEPAPAAQLSATPSSPAPYTAPGNTTADPLNFKLAERSDGAPATAVTAENRLSALQSTASTPVSSVQAERILNRVRSLDTPAEVTVK